VHAIDNSNIYYQKGAELTIAESVSEKLAEIIENPIQRMNMKSPNGVENPLSDDSILESIEILKTDLDTLILDCRSELKGLISSKQLLNY